MLDASAAVEIALWTATGSQLADHLQDADEVVVPDHFHLECAAALRRLELRNELTKDEAQAAFDHVLALRVRRVDTVPLLRPAWRMRHNTTLADALYVRIAQRLGVPLVTGDLRLARTAGLGIEVLAPPPPASL